MVPTHLVEIMTDRDEIVRQIASQLDMPPLTELPEGGGHYADWLPMLPVDTSDDDTPCIPIPCPSFTEVNIDAQQIGWHGLTFSRIEAGEPFTSLTFPEQVDAMWSDLCDQAALMRRLHEYDDDVAISIHLPDNPALAEVFDALKTRAVHGTPLRITLASEES